MFYKVSYFLFDYFSVMMPLIIYEARFARKLFCPSHHTRKNALTVFLLLCVCAQITL